MPLFLPRYLLCHLLGPGAPVSAWVRLRQGLPLLVGLLLGAQAHALSPYWTGQPLTPAPLTDQLARVEKKLQAEGLVLLGRHLPAGLPQQGVVVAHDPATQPAIRAVGGHAVLAAPVRVGVNTDGVVTYQNAPYWFRAYLRDQYAPAEPVVTQLAARLARALGQVAPLGGDVPADQLADYRYMGGMERLDALRGELHAYTTHEEAVATVRANLGKGVGHTRAVYEWLLPEQQLAVWGVAQNDPERGEAWWVGKLGTAGLAHTAALPYEIYVIRNKVWAPYGRFRIALAWPALDLGQFMSIRYAPDVIQGTLRRVAGAPEPSLGRR